MKKIFKPTKWSRLSIKPFVFKPFNKIIKPKLIIRFFDFYILKSTFTNIKLCPSSHELTNNYNKMSFQKKLNKNNRIYFRHK